VIDSRRSILCWSSKAQAIDQSLCVIPKSKSIMMERDHEAAHDALSGLVMNRLRCGDEFSKVWWLKGDPKRSPSSHVATSSWPSRHWQEGIESLWATGYRRNAGDRWITRIDVLRACTGRNARHTSVWIGAVIEIAARDARKSARHSSWATLPS
jgi:hypothetical protein